MFWTILVTLIGMAMSAAYFPQAIRIIRRRSSADVSLPSYYVFCLGTLTWTIYGITQHDWAVIGSFGLGVLGSWSVLIAALYYRRQAR